MDTPIRILLVDSREIRRAGLCCLLSGRAPFRVVGEAGELKAAVAVAAQKKPDVIIARAEALEHWEGFLSGMHGAAPKSRVLFLLPQSYMKATLVDRAVELGVQGVVFDHQGIEMLSRGIRKVAAGEMWLDRSMASRVLRRAYPHCSRRGEARTPITRRERQIVQLLGHGQRNKQIAAALSISEATVRNHMTAIFRKTGVSSRLELVLQAESFGIESPDEPLEP